MRYSRSTKLSWNSVVEVITGTVATFTINNSCTYPNKFHESLGVIPDYFRDNQGNPNYPGVQDIMSIVVIRVFYGTQSIDG